MLRRIVGSKLKSKLLDFFIQHPSEKFTLTDLVRKSELSLGGVHSTLKGFLKNELLVRGYDGKNEVFSLNLDSYVVESLLKINLILRPEMESLKSNVLQSMNTLAIYLLLGRKEQVLVVGTKKGGLKKGQYGGIKVKIISPEDYVYYEVPEEIPVYEKYHGRVIKPGTSNGLKRKMEEWYSDLVMAKQMAKESRKWAFMITYETCFSVARHLLGADNHVPEEDVTRTFEKEFVRKGLCPEKCIRLMKALIFRNEFPGNFEHASFYVKAVWSALDRIRETELPDMEISYES